MDGLMIDGTDLLEDYGYDIESITIRTAPAPKTKYIDITGMDGSLDYTEQDGQVRYKTGTMVIKVSKQTDMSEHYQQMAVLKRLCHGRKCKIILPYDPEYYLIGRISLKDSCEGYWSSAELTVTYEPYRYKIKPTIREKQISGSAELICRNLGMNVIPTINCSVAMRVIFNGADYSLAAGNNSVDDIIFSAGDNKLTFSGTGKVTVTYQEGWL